MKNVSKILLALVAVLCMMAVWSSDSDADAVDVTEVSNDSELQDAITNGATLIRLTQSMEVKDVTVPEGVTLWLPFSQEDTTKTMGLTHWDESVSETVSGQSASDKDVGTDQYGACTLRLTLTGTMDVKGTVIVGGVDGTTRTYYYQGHTASYHATIQNNGKIVVENGASVLCYGYIRGNGSVDVMRGASLTEPFVITDYVGGDNLCNLYDAGQSIFNRYTMNNIQCKMTIYSGSKLLALFNVFANSKFYSDSAEYIGGTNSFISLSDGAKATITYDASKYIESDESYNIHKDVGKTTVSIEGGATFGYIQLTISGQTLSSRGIPFSVPYNYDIVLNDGNYLMNCIYRLMPGSTLTISQDATLNLHGTLIAVWGLHDVDFRGISYPCTETLENAGFSGSARLIISGKLSLMEGSTFLGIAEMSGDSARLKTASSINTGKTTVEIGCNHKIDSTYVQEATNNLTTRQMAGYIVDENRTLQIIQPSTTYVSGKSTVYAKSSYSQDTGTYDLHQEFLGGWAIESSFVYTPVTIMSDTGTIDKDMIGSLVDEGKTHLDINVELDLTDRIIITEGALNLLNIRECKLQIHTDGYSLDLSSDLLQGCSERTVIQIGNLQLTEAQRSTLGERTHITVEISCGNEGGETAVNIFNDPVRVSIPCQPSNGDNIEKIQVWVIDEDGVAISSPAGYSDGLATFETASSGCFAIAFEDPPKDKIHFDETIVYVAIIAVAIIIAAIIILVIWVIKKKKKKNKSLHV